MADTLLRLVLKWLAVPSPVGCKWLTCDATFKMFLKGAFESVSNMNSWVVHCVYANLCPPKCVSVCTCKYSVLFGCPRPERRLSTDGLRLTKLAIASLAPVFELAAGAH